MSATRPHHRTVDRVAALLGAATTDPRGLTLTRLARDVGAPVSSVQKLVYGLVACGLLDEQDGRYVVGPAVAVLARRSGREPVDSPSHADLAALHERTGAAALLMVRVGDQAVVHDAVGLDDAAAYAGTTRWRHPLRATAGGRVLAAHLSPQQRRAWVADLLPEDPAAAMALLEELEQIRAAGLAVGAGGPLRPDLDAVAVPVRRGEEVVAALCLAVRRGSDVRTEDLESVLLEAQRT